MPDLTTGLVLQKEKAPPIVRSGGRGGQPHEWEKVIGPTISGSPGEDFLIYIYPDGEKPGDGWSEDDLLAAKRQAAARSASIANRYWNHVPDEHVETSVRQRLDGTFGVYATHHGTMTDEAKAKLANRRKPRVATSAQDAPGADEADVPAPTATAPPASPAPTGGPTAAERVKQAAKKQQGARR